jgi:hypothetical protein
MSDYRKYLRVASIVLGIVASTAAASKLAAQGGVKVRRPATAAAQPSLEPARSMLRHLVGRWRVEIRFAGNFDGPPDASGARVVDSLFDDLRLQWTEGLDSSHMRGQGIIGVDSRTGGFYSTAVYSTGSGTELLTGTLDLAEPFITFSPIAPSAEAGGARQAMESFVLRMVDTDHFTWSPLDRGWRALWTREP